MGTRTIRRTWRVNGVYTDPTSMKLSDATATYGVKRDDTNAVVVADGTSMDKVSTGVYTYTFTEPDDGLAYTAWVEVVYSGQTYRYEHDFPAFTSSSSSGLTVTYDSLMEDIGHWLGWQRSVWTGEQEATLQSIILSGARQFYWPPPLPGEARAHSWSFLRPVATLPTVATVEDYDLSADFGGLIGDLYFSEGDDVWHKIAEAGPGAILNYRQQEWEDAVPQFFAIVPDTADGTAPQNWILQLWPAPDAVYTLKYRYQITPEAIDSTHAYHLGNAMHSETLLASCLAVAEMRNRDGEATQQNYWLQRLAASVAHDRTFAPRHLGPYGDPRAGEDLPLTRRVLPVTYNSVLYD